MNFYVENKSLSFVKKAYESVTKNTKKDAYKAYIINYKGGFSKGAFRYFRKKGLCDIEYVIYGERGLTKAIKRLNHEKNNINLTVIIKKELSNKAKKSIEKAKKVFKVIDYTSNNENLSFYKSSNKILYKTNDEDTILDFDIAHIYKFYEPALQCCFSSCMGNNLYVDKKGGVHFCPCYLEKSIVGDIYHSENYFNNESMLSVLRKAIEKRNSCKKECSLYEYCNGACPMMDGCSDFPKLFEKNSAIVNQIKRENKDLSTQHYAMAKLIIKDIAYEN